MWDHLEGHILPEKEVTIWFYNFVQAFFKCLRVKGVGDVCIDDFDPGQDLHSVAQPIDECTSMQIIISTSGFSAFINLLNFGGPSQFHGFLF